MNINLKELNKQIKKSGTLIWTLEKGIHYITNRYWAVKFAELPREVLVQLFSIFIAVPEEGRSLVMTHFGDIENKPAVNIEKIIADAVQGAKTGEVTPFLKEVDSKLRMRVMKFDGFISYVNESYTKIIKNLDDSKPIGRATHMPISFNDNTLIILPFRISNGQDIETMNELLAV
jgi:hypothetical protein